MIVMTFNGQIFISMRISGPLRNPFGRNPTESQMMSFAMSLKIFRVRQCKNLKAFLKIWFRLDWFIKNLMGFAIAASD